MARSKPAAGKSATGKSAIGKSASGKPAIGKSAAGKTAAAKPATGKLAAAKPARPAAAPGFPQGRMPAIRRVMVPQDTNAMGTVFGGAILADIDLAAAIAARRHHPGTLVTVAMDKVEFKKPVFVGDVMTIFTDVVRIGRTSITIKVDVWAERRLTGGEAVPVTEALVTMVAVDEAFHPVPIVHR